LDPRGLLVQISDALAGHPAPYHRAQLAGDPCTLHHLLTEYPGSNRARNDHFRVLPLRKSPSHPDGTNDHLDDQHALHLFTPARPAGMGDKAPLDGAGGSMPAE
jgi:hypothetical protein